MRLKKENKALQRGLRVHAIRGAAGAFLVVILSLPLKAGAQPLALAGNPTPQPSAGLSDGAVAGGLSAACVKDIPLGAAGLLSRSFSLTRLAAEEQQAVQHKTMAQLQVDTPEIYMKFRAYACRWFEVWRQANQVPTTARQARAIKQADLILQKFFVSMGLPYKPLNVVFVPDQLFPGHLAGGIDTLFSEAIFLPAEDPYDFMEIALIHEGLHFNSNSTWPVRLEEGLVQLLTEDLIFVNGSIYAPERAGVGCILSALRKQGHLSKSVARGMLATAFMLNDMSQVEALLGKKGWQEIMALAQHFEGYWPEAILWNEYVKGIEKIRLEPSLERT
jgi:hypothetical protein